MLQSLKLYFKICRPFCSWISVFPAVVIFCLGLFMQVGPKTLFCIFLGGLVAVNLQHFANISDDLFSFLSGVDEFRELGKPGHHVLTGEASVEFEKKSLIFTGSLAALAGVLTVVLSDASILEKLIVLGFGLFCFLLAYSYSAGKIKYGVRGFGELGAFLGFGVFESFGLLWILLGKNFYNFDSLFLAIYFSFLFGIWAILLMMINNIRDIESDLLGKKKTFCAFLGERKSQLVFILFVIVETILANPFVLIKFDIFLQLILLVLRFPLIIIGYNMCKNLLNKDYFPTLKLLGVFCLTVILTMLVEFLAVSVYMVW